MDTEASGRWGVRRWMLMLVIVVVFLSAGVLLLRGCVALSGGHLGSAFTDARNSAVRVSVRRLVTGIERWRANHRGRVPRPSLVRQLAPGMTYSRSQEPVGFYVQPWPTNAFTPRPMAEGSRPGDFEYFVVSQGSTGTPGRFELVGHGPGGVPVIQLAR